MANQRETAAPLSDVVLGERSEHEDPAFYIPHLNAGFRHWSPIKVTKAKQKLINNIINNQLLKYCFAGESQHPGSQRLFDPATA